MTTTLPTWMIVLGIFVLAPAGWVAIAMLASQHRPPRRPRIPRQAQPKTGRLFPRIIHRKGQHPIDWQCTELSPYAKVEKPRRAKT